MAAPHRLLLTPASEKGYGRYSSLDTCEVGGDIVVVQVRDATLSSSLSYTVGLVDSRNQTTSWGEKTEYGSGQHPSVCLVKRGEKLYVVECHSSEVTRRCYYMVGVVLVRQKSIAWHHEELKFKCGYGKKLKISANNDALVVIMEEAFTLDGLQYHIAKPTLDDLSKCKIPWKLGPKEDKKFLKGVEPDISINNRGQVAVICRTFRKGILRAKLGTLANDKIEWRNFSTEITTSGANPTISLNSSGYVVEIHQAPWMQLSINCGKIVNEEEIEFDEESRTIHYGHYPAIALSDNNLVLETHCTPVGLSLFYTQGHLKNN